MVSMPIENFGLIPVLVGDGGLEPPTSTMSTWRSTPELIALPSNYHCASSRHSVNESPTDFHYALGQLPSELIALQSNKYYGPNSGAKDTQAPADVQQVSWERRLAANE